jgi:hypothetical protein
VPIWYIFPRFGIFSPVLVHLIKKNLATLGGILSFYFNITPDPQRVTVSPIFTELFAVPQLWTNFTIL